MENDLRVERRAAEGARVKVLMVRTGCLRKW
jgi:hypothetical protein